MADNAALDSAPDQTRAIALSDCPARLAGVILKAETHAFESWLPRPGQAASPHAIHQLRVALRRLRVALKLFESVVPPAAGQLRVELGWLGRVLGEIRDLDVHADALHKTREALPEHAAALARLEARNDAARSTARARLARTLENERTGRLRAALADLAGRDFEGEQAAGDTLTIAESCAARIGTSLKRLRKLGRKLDAGSSAADLHRVRIRSKRLRYEMEFFAPLVPELEPLLRATRRLQTVLGAHNDAVVAAARLRKQASVRSGSIVDAEALEAAIRRQKKDAARARTRFEAAWRRFEREAARTQLQA